MVCEAGRGVEGAWNLAVCPQLAVPSLTRGHYRVSEPWGPRVTQWSVRLLVWAQIMTSGAREVEPSGAWLPGAPRSSGGRTCREALDAGRPQAALPGNPLQARGPGRQPGNACSRTITSSSIFKDFLYLFTRDAEGEAGSLQGPRRGTRSRDPGVMPWAQGRRSTAEPPRGAPIILLLNVGPESWCPEPVRPR